MPGAMQSLVRPRPAHFLSIVLLLPALFFLPARVAGQPGLDQTGKWTPLDDPRADWLQTQIHMALLRGDGTYHSKILSWQGGTGSSFGKLWGWNGGTTGCSSILSTEFQELPLTHPGSDIFCAGHAALSNGDLMINGGHDVNGVGIKQSTIFRPNPPAGQSQWQTQGSMSQGRWYPTTVMLPDGKAMTFSGNRFEHVMAIGGTEFPQDPTSMTRNDINRLGVTKAGEWIAAITPPPPPTPWPQPVEGHVAMWHDATSSTVVFGGRTTGGDPLNAAGQLLFEASEIGYNYRWQRITPQPEDTPPDPASRQSGVVLNDNSIVFYGGLKRNSVASGEVWKLFRDVLNRWRWELLSPNVSDGSPGARYAHAAAYDFDADAVPVRNRLLVFGGLGPGAATTDDEVWALDFNFNPPKWTRPDLRGAQRPATRNGHSLVADPAVRLAPSGSNEKRMVMFGGDGSTDPLWALWIAANGELQWEFRPASGPTARSRHSAVWETAHDRMVVYGGSVGTSTSTSETWAVNAALSSWTQLQSGPAGLAGSAAVMLPRTLNTIDHELFDPATGNWQYYAPPKLQLAYPFMSTLPSGNLFYSGPVSQAQILKLSQSPIVWQNAGSASGFKGGSAVMYRPGQIMKCGSTQEAPGTLPEGTTARIAFDNQDATQGWFSSINQMMPRVYHNLTVLPNGKVLVTGGLSVQGQGGNLGVRSPEVWNPDAGNGMWSGLGVLEQDPAVRGYHSTALLLPDGRVLSGGGSGRLQDQTRITVYCPSYLFDSSGGLAPRPVIQAAADSVVYGHAITVVIPQAGSIARACLIRPGAVTHGFNQEQRYVPLTILNKSGQELLLDAPADAKLAPPGDYLLFLVDDVGVPSIAKWVRVRGQSEDGACTDVTPALVALSADAGRTNVVLSWLAPGENGNCGTAQAFDLRRSTAGITESNFYSATRVTMNVPSPGTAGTVHCMEIFGLSACTNYHFAIKTRDSQGAWSKISNGASVQTLCSSYASALCDGGGLLAGGGGPGEGSAGQLSLFSAGSVSGIVGNEESGENSLLWPGAASEVVDLRRFGGSLGEGEGQHSVQLRQAGSWRASIDHLSLGVVDHDAALQAFAGTDSVLLGTIEPVANVTDAAGEVVTGPLGGTTDPPFVGRAGEHVLVRLGGATMRTALVIESRGAAPRVGEDTGGILVQRPGAAGNWMTISEVHPRRRFDRCAVPTEGSESIRLVFLREYALQSLAQLNVARTVAPQPLELVVASHSGLGEVGDAIRQSGGTATLLEPGDTMSLAFTVSAAAPGNLRDFFLMARGSMTPAEAQGSSELARAGTEPGVARRFGVGPARPNPSIGTVAIDYTLAHRAHVNLRVYNVTGRLVRTLVSEELSAGARSVAWDGRDDRGQRVRAGTYFYRMVAGDWHSERKLILVQK